MREDLLVLAFDGFNPASKYMIILHRPMVRFPMTTCRLVAKVREEGGPVFDFLRHRQAFNQMKKQLVDLWKLPARRASVTNYIVEISAQKMVVESVEHIVISIQRLIRARSLQLFLQKIRVMTVSSFKRGFASSLQEDERLEELFNGFRC